MTKNEKESKESPMDNPLIIEARRELSKKYEEIYKEYGELNRTYFKNLLREFIKVEFSTKIKLTHGTTLSRLACMISDNIYQRCELSDLLFVSTASLLKALIDTTNKDANYVEACIGVYKLIIKPLSKEFKLYQEEVLFKNRPLITEDYLKLSTENRMNWKDFEEASSIKDEIDLNLKEAETIKNNIPNSQNGLDFGVNTSKITKEEVEEQTNLDEIGLEEQEISLETILDRMG